MEILVSTGRNDGLLLTAPSPNRCWLIINQIRWYSFQGKYSLEYSRHQSCKLCLKVTYFDITATSYSGRWLDAISMALCKTAVTPLLTHWSYCSLALSHRYHIECNTCNDRTCSDIKLGNLYPNLVCESWAVHWKQQWTCCNGNNVDQFHRPTCV